MATLNVNNTSASFNVKQIDITLIENSLDGLIKLENIQDQWVKVFTDIKYYYEGYIELKMIITYSLYL